MRESQRLGKQIRMSRKKQPKMKNIYEGINVLFLLLK